MTSIMRTIVRARPCLCNISGRTTTTSSTTSVCFRRNVSSSSSSSSSKRPRVTQPGLKAVSDVWYNTSSGRPRSSSLSLDMGRYGLKRLDYKTLDPPIWSIPPHPPTKSLKERIAFPLTLVVVAGVALWAYMNPEEEDMQDYWKRVETGQILVDDDDDDDDGWDNDDDDDEED